ncbi:MAG: PilN domain-containing protein [Desulfobacterales bacterium]|nr:PilN domain-containing protein [Desulfobacterales bacterium]
MIRINLLPFRAARKKENVRRQVSIFILSIIFIAFALGYYSMNLNSKIHKLDKKLEDIKKEVAKYKKISEEITNIKAKLATLNKKTDVIKNLELNRKEPIHLLDTMTNVLIPNRIWFTHFQTKEKDTDIEGIALDNKTVADFMTRLENSGLFANVNLRTLKQKKIQNYNLNSFRINCKKRSLEKVAKNKAEK